MPKRSTASAKRPVPRHRVAPQLAVDAGDDFILDDDDFPLHPPRGPRRFVKDDPLWRRVLMRPSLYLSPLIVGTAVSAFLINALMLQNGARGAMTLGWPFNALSHTVIERGSDQPTQAKEIIPLPPKRSDAGEIGPNLPAQKTAETGADPYADLIKTYSNTPSSGDPSVSRAQRVLNRLGYGPVPVDGQMSPATRTALQRFSRDRGLTPGPQTETAILKQLGRSGETTQD